MDESFEEVSENEYEIVPAIMPASYEDVADHVARVVNDRIETVQLDIMDGRFVPDDTWPYTLGGMEGALEDSTWQSLQEEDDGLPFWESIDYELDLMVRDLESTWEQWVNLGPKRIIVHYESLLDPVEFIKTHTTIRPFIELGIALNNDTPLDVLEPLIEYVDCIQLMGIARIGYQKEPFDTRVIERITECKERFPETPIQIDGAVNNETIEKLALLGVERFVIGSAFFG